MAIPISYSLRNLAIRKTTGMMTTFGIASSVAILVTALAMLNGLRSVFQGTANPLQLLVLRSGATSELSSSISRDAFAVLQSEPGVAVGQAGEPVASPEVVQVVNLTSVDHPQGTDVTVRGLTNVTVRGLTMVGVGMRTARLDGGRWFQPGQREVVVGKAVAQRHPGAALGRRIRFADGPWTVVGIVDGGQSALNSEIWGDFETVDAAYHRREAASSVLLRARDSLARNTLKQAIEGDRRLNVSAVTEREYYARQTAAGAPLEFLGFFVALMMAIGGAFSVTNTMYAAVAARAREVGTLRTLGFSQASIQLSFTVESMLLSLLAGLLGCLLVLPLNWVTIGIGNFVSFSEIAFRFRVSALDAAIGAGFAVILGALGGWLPARAAARKEILNALREG